VILRRDVDAFVSPSRYLAQMYVAAGFDAPRIHLVWKGIDLERFGRIERRPLPEAVRFSFFGHFGRHKGVQVLIDAFAQLRDPSAARLNLVGDGEMRDLYRDAIAANGCKALVRFWGKVPNDRVECAYRETDVVVLPSLWPENQPVSIKEAMAASLPVIATDMGGNPELVRHGVNGLLVPAGDVHALAAAMQAFIDAPELIERMGHRGRERIRGTSYEAQARTLVKLYRTREVRRIAPAVPRVAWVGDRFPEGSDALPRAVERNARTLVHFVHADWLTEADAGSIALRWNVDEDRPAQADAWTADVPELVTSNVAEASQRIAAKLAVATRRNA